MQIFLIFSIIGSMNNEEIKKDIKQKKKLPAAVKVLLLPFELILILLIVLLLWFTFCFFDRVQPVEALPPDFAIYLRTDSVRDTVEPLLDHDASLIAMTSPALQKNREAFLKLKSSPLRKNFFVRKSLQRRFDAALYENGAVGVLDSGFLAGAVRLAPYAIPHVKALSGKLELSSNRHGSYYQAGDALFLVFKKNLIIFSTDKELLEEAMTWTNSQLYQQKELETVNQKLKEPLRIFANGEKLLALLTESQKSEEKEPSAVTNYMKAILPYLSGEEYTELSFGITEKDLNVKVTVPMLISQTEDNPLIHLLEKDSRVPGLLPQLGADIQYYTLITSGTLQDLRDSAVKVLPAEKNFQAAWKKSDSLCRLVFNRSLDELLFSWTADEFAFFGIEGKAEPVLALKISDEKKRRDIFDRVFSSYVINSNDSLLVDGVRLPRIEMPGFLLSIMQLVNINIPKPYYLVKDDYIYFSQSPENLAAINTAFHRSQKLTSSENWQRVSSNQTPDSSLSLYYNLERSVPFFVKGSSAMSKILALYNSGRFDLRVKDNVLAIQLQASAVKPDASNHIPGFPIELENRSDARLVQSKAKKSRLIFWLENNSLVNNSLVNSLDCSTFERKCVEYPDLQYIVAASEANAKTNGGELWAVTKNGMVYLLNSKLESVFGYPLLTGINMDCEPFIYKDSLVLAGNDGELCFVSQTGEISLLETEAEGGIKARPSVHGDILAFYEKGFFGGIHIYKNLEAVTKEGPLELDGIAYGSPCLFTAGGKDYAAMITQAGQLYVYDIDGQALEPFPVGLNGVFYLNVQMADGYLFALSEEGDLYRVGLDGKAMRVKLPYFTAKTGRITVCDYDEKAGEEIFVSGEGNSLYGFNSALELLPGFPVSGYGNPLFIDLNGDNKNDCLSITFDNRLSAARVLAD